MANFEILHKNSAQEKPLNLNFQPGQKGDSSLILKNNSSEPITIQLSTEPAHINKSQQLALSPTNTPSLDSWITLPQTEISIPANSTKEIPFQVSIPLNASTANHQSIITAKEVTAQPTNEIQVIEQKGLQVSNQINQTATLEHTEPAPSPNEFNSFNQFLSIPDGSGVFLTTILFIIGAVFFLKKFRFTGALLGILSISIFLIPTFAQEDEEYNPKNNYLTLQWGNVYQTLLPKSQQSKIWDFTISSPDAQISVDTHLDFENRDQTEQINQNSIRFTTTTDNEVDGAIILVNSEKTTDPVFTFTDNITQNEISLTLTDLRHEQVFYSGRQSTHILASDMYYKAKRFFIYTQEEDLHDLLDATPDLEAFLETPATPQINVEEIQEIFSQLPATYENFNELRPDYDLIHKIIAASGQVSVFADPILITEIAASPDLLRSIATNPQRSLSFFSNRRLIFPKQEFDFNEEKIISIPMNEMLFTHENPGQWKTYIEASNFISTTNNNTIRATNLCIVPGEIQWITEPADNYFIESKYCFKSNTDKLLLLERFVSNPTTFKIRPTLELKIPKNTPPSVYRGILTFTEI